MIADTPTTESEAQVSTEEASITVPAAAWEDLQRRLASLEKSQQANTADPNRLNLGEWSCSPARTTPTN